MGPCKLRRTPQQGSRGLCLHSNALRLLSVGVQSRRSTTSITHHQLRRRTPNGEAVAKVYCVPVDKVKNVLQPKGCSTSAIMKASHGSGWVDGLRGGWISKPSCWPPCSTQLVPLSTRGREGPSEGRMPVPPCTFRQCLHSPRGEAASACTVGRCPLCPRTPLLRAGGADQPGHGPGGGRLWLP